MRSRCFFKKPIINHMNMRLINTDTMCFFAPGTTYNPHSHRFCLAVDFDETNPLRRMRTYVTK